MSENKYISLVTVEYLTYNGVSCQEYTVPLLPLPGVDNKEFIKLRAVNQFKAQHPGCAVRRVRVHYCVPEHLAPQPSLVINKE